MAENRFLNILGILFVCLLVASIGLLLSFEFRKEPLISPLASNPVILSAHQKPELKKEVIGFLPFWTIKEEPNFRYDLLTQIIYMGVEFDKEGNLVKTENGYLDPTWANFNSERLSAIIHKAKKAGAKVLLGIQCYNNDTLESIVNHPLRRKRVIEQALELLQQKNFDGINIDFEHSNSPSSSTSQNFTRFVQDLTKAVKLKSPAYLVSIDVYADSLVKNRIYQVETISLFVDHIIIMAYDFHRANSISAGPVAPLRSAHPASYYSLTKTMADFYQAVPKEKLILAVPYYGYEWQTASEKFGASAYPGSGALATYKRVINLVEAQSVKINWDSISMTPWLVYKNGGQTKQIYFDNPYSLSLKYQLIKEADIAGVALWALGYDGQRPELWQLLEEKFRLL